MSISKYDFMLNCSLHISLFILGFILSKIASFQSIAPPDYETAGYRGRLTNGFIKEDAITHIFKKGGKISLSTSEYL